MKYHILAIILLSGYFNIFSQQKLNNKNSFFFRNDLLNNVTILLTPSPTLIIENKKVYFGISKEVSLGLGSYSEHRLAFEYTYVFRDSINNHLRFSYNYDLYPNSMINITAGAGYFTDTYKNGIFPQLSVSAIASGDIIYYIFYFKTRVTFALQKEHPGLFDVSAGLSIGLTPFGAKPRKGLYL